MSNDQEVFDKFLKLYSSNDLFHEILSEDSSLTLDDCELYTIDSYKEKYFNYKTINKETYDFENDSKFIQALEDENEQITERKAIIDDLGFDVLLIESERVNSRYSYIWRVGSTYIKAEFPYDSYSGTDYSSGEFYIVYPKKVEQISWEYA